MTGAVVDGTSGPRISEEPFGTEGVSAGTIVVEIAVLGASPGDLHDMTPEKRTTTIITPTTTTAPAMTGSGKDGLRFTGSGAGGGVGTVDAGL